MCVDACEQCCSESDAAVLSANDCAPAAQCDSSLSHSVIVTHRSLLFLLHKYSNNNRYAPQPGKLSLYTTGYPVACALFNGNSSNATPATANNNDSAPATTNHTTSNNNTTNVLGSLLSVVEGNAVSLWDVRVSGSAACVQRLSDGGGALTCVSTHDSGYLAAGGVDRTVTVYDLRKYSVVNRWINVLKHEMIHLFFSTVNVEYIYVTGLDQEIYCGNWYNTKLNTSTLKRNGFRGILSLLFCISRSV